MRRNLIMHVLREKEFVHMDELKKKLKVSDRTIRGEIKDLNKEGEKLGFRIINLRGKGYHLEIEKNENFKGFIKKIEKFKNLDGGILKEDRVEKILGILLTSSDYVTIDNIAERLQYSRSTIINDMEDVDKRIGFLNLELEKKSGAGMRINNEEIKIRKALSTYLYGSNESLRVNEKETKELFFKIKEVFLGGIIKNKIDISNLSIENIFYHLQILLLRIKNGNFIKEDTSNKSEDWEFENYEKFEEIAREIFEIIGNEFKIDVPKKEINYLASQIYYKSKVFIKDNNVKTRVREDIIDILKGIDENSYTNLSEDKELINNLHMHLCALISRARSNTQLKNPYFEEVNTRYSAIVAIAVNFSNEFSKRWDLNLIKDEIGFIAIHFATHFEKLKLKSVQGVNKIGIICPDEGGISYLLKLKLEKEFSDTIIDTFTRVQSSNALKGDYDFIVTNMDLGVTSDKEIFKIDNLFDEKEFNDLVFKIEKSLIINGINGKEKVDKVFFKKLQGGDSVDYMEFLRGESRELNKLGFVDENFEELVILREKSLSTAYKNGVAGPHAMVMNARKNAISITVFEKEISWKDKNINIVFLIAMKKGSLELHKKIGSSLFNIINNKDLREKLLKANSLEEL